MNNMEGYPIVKKSKDRKMDKKSKHKALAVVKTEKSRKRRLYNKAKRAEIHAINPDIKIVIKDQITYDELGTELMVEDGQVKCVEPEMIMPLPTVEVFDAEIEEVEAVEVDDVSRFQELIKKWRL